LVGVSVGIAAFFRCAATFRHGKTAVEKPAKEYRVKNVVGEDTNHKRNLLITNTILINLHVWYITPECYCLLLWWSFFVFLISQKTMINITLAKTLTQTTMLYMNTVLIKESIFRNSTSNIKITKSKISNNEANSNLIPIPNFL